MYDEEYVFEIKDSSRISHLKSGKVSTLYFLKSSQTA